MQHAISFTTVKKSYHTPDGGSLVLYDNLTFGIESGTFASLMGSSGAGKSTILNLIAGLTVPDSGTIYVLGEDITRMTDEEKTLLRGRHIGFIFQSFNLLPYLTVQENIDINVDLQLLPRRFDTAELCELVGLGKKRNNYPHQLSGGEQQRVGIARALVGDTSLILADEPTGNLDARTTEQIMTLLHDLHQRIGCTIVLITHDPEVAKQAGQQLRLEQGGIVEKIAPYL